MNWGAARKGAAQPAHASLLRFTLDWTEHEHRQGPRL
jgi:hypothetical protein